MPDDMTIDFCRNCSVPLTDMVKLTDDAMCPNCGAPVGHLSERIVGRFYFEDFDSLLNPPYEDFD